MHRNRFERTASKRWRGSVRRVVSAAIYNLSCFTHGCSTGWVSGVLGNEALTGGAWLAALPCLVALPAAPFFAVLADARGRKAGAFCICLSFIFSWCLAAWCGHRGIWAARVAAGAGGAGSLALAPVYSAEIAPRTRGLAALPAFACSCGILFAYAAAGMLTRHALSLWMAVPPTVLLVSLLWLPETPSFLISIGRIQDAAKVICWFDGSDFREDLTDVIEQQEVRIRTSECHGSRRRDLCRQDSDTFQPMLKRSSGLESNSDKKNEPSALRELFRHRRSRRALVSCCALLGVAAGSGVGAVTSFAASVLSLSARDHALTGHNLAVYNGSVSRGLFDTSEAASLLCGAALVLGAAIATITVDKLGRKVLLIWSCSGIAFCLALLGAYCDPRFRMHSWSNANWWPFKTKLASKELYNLSNAIQDATWVDDTKHLDVNKSWIRLDSGNATEKERDSGISWTQIGDNVTDFHYLKKDTLWPPVILLSAVLFLYNIGLGSIPFVLVSELFSANVRSLASSFLISWMWLSCFLLLRYFGTVTHGLGLHGTYYVCASITFLGSWYTYLFIPETKGKTQEQIDDALDGPLLVGLRRRRKETEDP